AAPTNIASLGTSCNPKNPQQLRLTPVPIEAKMGVSIEASASMKWHQPEWEVDAMASLTRSRKSVQRRKVNRPRFCKLVRYPDGSRALVIRQVLSKNREQVDGYTLTES